MGGCGSKTPDPPAGAAQGVIQAEAPRERGASGGGKQPPGKFQIKLSNRWQDYEDTEDRVLKRAFLIGQNNAKFHLRGNDYEYSFKNMKQTNLRTNAVRDIRAPRGLKKPPAPMLPPGATVIVTVPPGSAGKTIEIPDPNNPGRKVPVNVPAGAKPGQKMAVPVPGKGETMEAVCQKQKGWSTGGKTAAAIGVVGVGAVGGALLGDHLTGGTMAVDGASAVADVATDAYGAVADWAPGAADAVGDWGGDAAGAVGDWGEGAIDDIGDVAADVGDWLGDAVEDAGDWIMDIF